MSPDPLRFVLKDNGEVIRAHYPPSNKWQEQEGGFQPDAKQLKKILYDHAGRPNKFRNQIDYVKLRRPDEFPVLSKKSRPSKLKKLAPQPSKSPQFEPNSEIDITESLNRIRTVEGGKCADVAMDELSGALQRVDIYTCLRSAPPLKAKVKPPQPQSPTTKSNTPPVLNPLELEVLRLERIAQHNEDERKRELATLLDETRSDSFWKRASKLKLEGSLSSDLTSASANDIQTSKPLVDSSAQTSHTNDLEYCSPALQEHVEPKATDATEVCAHVTTLRAVAIIQSLLRRRLAIINTKKRWRVGMREILITMGGGRLSRVPLLSDLSASEKSIINESIEWMSCPPSSLPPLRVLIVCKARIIEIGNLRRKRVEETKKKWRNSSRPAKGRHEITSVSK